MDKLPEINGSVLWLEPGQSSASHFRKWIKRLAEKINSPLFDPHITLSRNLNLATDVVKQNLQIVAERQAAFRLRLFPAECRSEPYQKIVVPVQINTALSGLYGIIDDVFGESFSKRKDPHLSLHYSNLPCTEFREIVQQVNSEESLELYIQNISLMVLEGTPEAWKKSFRVPLND